VKTNWLEAAGFWLLVMLGALILIMCGGIIVHS